MRQQFHKKYVALGGLVLLVLLGIPTITHGQGAGTGVPPSEETSALETIASTLSAGFSILSINFSVFGKILFFFGQVASWTAGILIALETWVLTLVLTINGNIVNSPVVQAGFPAVLALANLGFVLGIIVIAISTILRKQTYGLKQILW